MNESWMKIHLKVNTNRVVLIILMHIMNVNGYKTGLLVQIKWMVQFKWFTSYHSIYWWNLYIQFRGLLLTCWKRLTSTFFSDEMCWSKLVNKLPMHARRAQEGMCRENVICCSHIFCTYIVWCQLPHLNGCWIHLWHVYTNVRLFVIWYYECQNIPW